MEYPGASPSAGRHCGDSALVSAVTAQASALHQRLSEDRADYISDQLMALGMSSGHIELQALGGIEEFTPIANNRYCKIQLIPL